MSSKTILISLALLAILLGAGLYLFNQQTAQQEALQGTSVIAEQPAVDDTATTAVITPDQQDPSLTDTQQQAPDATQVPQADLAAATSVRALGNPNAPVVIQEFSSLTCGHCGEFHKNAFDQIKAEYIDTGKVYLIFRDFPLNAPAVTGTMVARCLPAERYYGFVDLLFKNQDKWAYDRNYMNYLRQNAALAGLGQEAFDACVNNNELRTAITNLARDASMKYEINSTPSFVINETTVLTGAREYSFYKQAIDAELAKAASAPAPAPANNAATPSQTPVAPVAPVTPEAPVASE